MSKEDIIRLGNSARELLKSETFVSVTEAVRANAFQGWAATNPEQTKEREEFYYLLLAIGKVTQTLQGLEQSGLLEQRKLERDEQEAAQQQQDGE
jgi:hypothetical protein